MNLSVLLGDSECRGLTGVKEFASRYKQQIQILSKLKSKRSERSTISGWIVEIAEWLAVCSMALATCLIEGTSFVLVLTISVAW